MDRVADLLAARAGLDQPLQGAVHVENEEQDKPLMLYLAYQEPHAPLMVDPKYEALYPEEEEPSRRTYLGMVSSVDDSVGRIVQMMRDYTYTDPSGEVRSMYDDTVFLFRCISNVFIQNRVLLSSPAPIMGGCQKALVMPAEIIVRCGEGRGYQVQVIIVIMNIVVILRMTKIDKDITGRVICGKAVVEFLLLSLDLTSTPPVSRVHW